MDEFWELSSLDWDRQQLHSAECFATWWDAYRSVEFYYEAELPATFGPQDCDMWVDADLTLTWLFYQATPEEFEQVQRNYPGWTLLELESLAWEASSEEAERQQAAAWEDE